MESLLLGIDPGETTGLCWHTVERNIWMWESLGPEEHHAALWELLNKLRPEHVFLERFDLRHSKEGVNPISLEYIGVVKTWITTTTGHTLHLQSASDAKSVWTNAKLKKLEIELPKANPAHCRDAMRHVLLGMQKELQNYTFLRRATHPG